MNKLPRLYLTEKIRMGFVVPDNDAVFITDGNPFAQAGVGPEPRDDRRLRHQCKVERAGVAAEVQRAVPDDGSDLREVQIPGENTPRFLWKQREQFLHFPPLAFGGRAGQRQLFSGEIFPECGHKLCELLWRELLVIGGRERADMKISSGVILGNFGSTQIGRIYFDVKFRLCERETSLR